MIEVTRLNGTVFFINPDLLMTVEATPDTVITLTNNEKLIVKESPEVIIERFLAVKRAVYQERPVVRTVPAGD
jgi:flagellar protein FlbD